MLLLMLVSPGLCAEPPTLSELLQELSVEHAAAARRFRADQPLSQQLWVVQQLLTTNFARDGARDGGLSIPYFWHWVEPNPRLSILRMPGREPLGELPPPQGYEKYQAWGFVDRDPSLYLGDLATETPGYTHPRHGDFYSFGWCSEREMALCTLLDLWGHEVKILQEGIHVTTRVWLGGERPEEMLLDTTFDLAFQEHLEEDATLESWRADIGAGTDIDRYNRVCHSANEKAEVAAIRVGPQAEARIRQAAARWFSAD